MQRNGPSSRVTNIPINSVSIRHQCDIVGCINLFNGKNECDCECAVSVRLCTVRVCVYQCVCVCVCNWEITYNAAFPNTTVLSIPHSLPHCISLTYCQMKSSNAHCIEGKKGVWVFSIFLKNYRQPARSGHASDWVWLGAHFTRVNENSMIKRLVNAYVVNSYLPGAC